MTTLRPFQDHWLLGLLIFILCTSVAVALHHLSFWTALLCFTIAVGTTIIRARSFKKEDGIDEEKSSHPLPRSWRLVGMSACIILQLLVTITLIHSQTGAAISSPWQMVPNSIFFCFGAALFLLLLLSEQLSFWTKRLLWSWQYLISFGVTAIVYRYGFGFDPFIHQAATRYLAEHGSIQLPSFLYIGQYAFEASLHKLTWIPIAVIDRWLVPAFATILANVILTRLNTEWRQPEKVALALPLLLLPFLPLTFTVPYQVAYLSLTFTVYALPFLSTQRGIWLSLGLITVTGLFHPLLAVPIAGLIAGSWLTKRSNLFSGTSAFLVTSTGLISAFSIYIHQHGGVMIVPTVTSLSAALRVIFGFPYDLTTWTWYAKGFYGLIHLWPLVFISIGWIGYGQAESLLRKLRPVYIGTALAMLFVAIGLAASTTFADIISTEQFEFALRLRYATPLLFMPGVAIALHAWIEKRPETLRPWAFFGLAVFITGIWYTSYPQWNRFVHQSSVGVSETDIHTVQAIERLSDGKTYAALTPQMTSAAALHLLGFEHELSPSSTQRYPYAIPTGGAFYQQYLRLWYETDVQGIISEARSLSQEQQLFIAIPKQWDPRTTIHSRLTPISTVTEEVDNTINIYQLTQ